MNESFCLTKELWVIQKRKLDNSRCCMFQIAILLSTFISDGITVSAQYVYSTPVFLHSRLSVQPWFARINNKIKKEDSYVFPEVIHRHDNPVVSLTKYVNKFIYMLHCN